MTVSAGFGIFYLVRDNEVISISSASIYKDVGQKFTIDVDHRNPKASTTIDISTSDAGIVSYDEKANTFTAESGGVARVNFRTSNTKFRNIWCDVVVGDGTVESPFYISTAEQLASIGRGALDEELGVYAGAEGYENYTSNACYKLVADIDVITVNGGCWVPLKEFSGRFDGNGYTISNVNFNADIYTADGGVYPSTNVGFFEKLTKDAVVYDVKFNNVGATGEYTNFGTVTAINQGTIERVEVKNADFMVDTEVFGGLVAINETTETLGTNYARNIARIDRCSISMNFGSENSEISSDDIIGGIVGQNNGGTIAYSYAVGNIYFDASDETIDLMKITYGGIVAENSCIKLNGKGGNYTSTLQGANVKDCYSAIKTISTPYFDKNMNANMIIAGAIGLNRDISEGVTEVTKDASGDTTKYKDIPVVQNYIVGVYYSKDNLNYVSEESTGTLKSFEGIGKFTYYTTSKDEDFDYSKTSGIPVNFQEKVYAVSGLSNVDMTVASSFVSHYTKEIGFTEDGTSLGIQTSAVTWLFDTVWGIDTEINGGMPYLNYQLVYVPDDFGSVGTPIILNGDYDFDITIDYAITITSAVNGKIKLYIGQEYDLKISPKGAEVTWASGDSSVVTVDENGHIVAISKGMTTVTAMTDRGSTDTINVIVEDIKYEITNYPKSLTLTTGETYTFKGVSVYPENTTIEYSVQNTLYASITKDGVLTANRETVVPTYVFITAGTTKVAIPLTIKSASSGNPVTPDDPDKDNPVIPDNPDKDNPVIPTPVTPTFELIAYNITLETGDTYQLKARANNVDTSANGRVTWVSGNENVATITSNGLITAISRTPSHCTITVTYSDDNGLTMVAYCIVNVLGVKQVVLTANPTSLYIEAGKSASVTLSASLSGTAVLNDDSNRVSGVTTTLSNANSTSPVLNITTKDTSVNVNGKPMTVKVKFNADNGTTASVTISITINVEKAYSKYIYNATQLNAIRYHLDKDFILASNIDLSLTSWEPIGSSSEPFTGTFTNQGAYVISGFTASETYAGLFGYTNKANISGIRVENANISGLYAGGIVGYAISTNLSNTVVTGSTITATKYAGGIVGYACTNSAMSNCQAINNSNIQVKYNSTLSGARAVGGIAGYALSSTISNARVEGGLVSMEANEKLTGYAGGVVGYTNATVKTSLVLTTITIGTKSSDNYAGGIVGYTTSAISDCTVRSATITGYNAGGIGGALNNAQTVSLTFDNYKKGYRKGDLKSSSYYVNVATTAVRETVRVSGNRVGGLFGIINAGVVKNCYSRAELNGTSSSAVKGGFASEIKSNGFKNNGGAGTCGIVENCYSACTFSGSGDNYSVTSSLIHNYFTFGDGSERTAGYIFNYVFDNDLDGKATYYFGSNLWGKDYVGAKKSTSDMKSASTYSDKSFSTSYWNLNGYPTLKSEK